MMNAGSKLFAKIHRRKRFANPNHDVHLMARNISDWLTHGVQSIINGTYNPRCLKRHYFPDDVVDQLHLSDRILQNLLLKQLKLTFTRVMNPNCYHLHGPSGVKLATQRIKEALAQHRPKYIIRADIKSYYKSIRHHLLLQDIRRYYNDPRVVTMLENIIKNPDYGIALQGPLSQFFSALYLKPLDDAFDNMEVTYLRYQDDVIVLCQTERQLKRCKQRLMNVLQERRLCLSSKKTRIGSIDKSFHFLGINYPGTQTQDSTGDTQDQTNEIIQFHSEQTLPSMGGENSSLSSDSLVLEQKRIVPHARTLRNAREYVKQMVASGVSLHRIKRYLLGWCRWWMQTSESWSNHDLLHWFIESCWDETARAIASGLQCFPVMLNSSSASDEIPAAQV